MRKTMEQAVSVLFSAVFAVCSFFTLFHFEKYPLGFNHSSLKTAVFTLIPAALAIGYVKLLDGKIPRRANIIRLTSALLLGAVQFLLFLKVLTPIGWDALEITNSAEFGMYNGEYFAGHTNNLFMQIMLSGWLRALGGVPLLSALRKMELLNLLFVDAAIVMSVLTVRKLYGMKAADRVFICSVLLIGFHPTLSTVYSDTLAMPFPIGTLFCLVCAGKGKPGYKQILYVCGAGILGTVGYYIKPTVLIVYIAAFVLVLLRWKKEYLQKRTLFFIACFLLSAGISVGTVKAIERPVLKTLSEEYPDVISLGLLHYAGLGLGNLDDDPSGYGGWNEAEVNWTRQHINHPDYKKEALEHIRSRLSDYGPLGYLEQLFNKLVWAGSDGTFFYGMEGDFHLEEQSSQDTLRGFLQNGFYIETDFYQNWFSSWMQGVWLMICLKSMLSVFGRSDDMYSATAKLSVLGLFLFLLLFENRSRYLFLYLPVILTVPESGFPPFFFTSTFPWISNFFHIFIRKFSNSH